MQQLSFKECYPTLEKMVSKKVKNWHVGIAWYDAQDVKQEILTHIEKQWGKWEQSKSNVERYWQSVIHNQFINKLRDWHFKYQPPCVKCPYNVVSFDATEAKALCSRPNGSGVKDCGCELYAKWSKTKRDRVHLHYTVSDEFHQNEESVVAECSEDVDFRLDNFIEKMKLKLNKRQFEIFSMIFLEKLEWQTVAQKLGVKSVDENSKKGSKGHRLYTEWEKRFLIIGKELLKEMF